MLPSFGLTTGFNENENTHTEESERLIMLVLTGTKTEEQSFRREVFKGSSSHCLLGRQLMMSDTSASEATLIANLRRLGSDNLASRIVR